MFAVSYGAAALLAGVFLAVPRVRRRAQRQRMARLLGFLVRAGEYSYLRPLMQSVELRLLCAYAFFCGGTAIIVPTYVRCWRCSRARLA